MAGSSTGVQGHVGRQGGKQMHWMFEHGRFWARTVSHMDKMKIAVLLCEHIPKCCPGLPVACCCRRAKRLRRLLRQLDSPVARSALLRFWRGTWVVVAVLLLAHIVCYAILATMVGTRHT